MRPKLQESMALIFVWGYIIEWQAVQPCWPAVLPRAGPLLSASCYFQRLILRQLSVGQNSFLLMSKNGVGGSSVGPIYFVCFESE